MEITQKILNVQFQYRVAVGANNAIEADLCFYSWISEDKNGEINVDIDFTDINNVHFLGIPIEGGYAGYKKFKAQMLELGINVEELFDEKSSQLITDEDMKALKSMYRKSLRF